jgi:hypothetical protein
MILPPKRPTLTPIDPQVVADREAAYEHSKTSETLRSFLATAQTMRAAAKSSGFAFGGLAVNKGLGEHLAVLREKLTPEDRAALKILEDERLEKAKLDYQMEEYEEARDQTLVGKIEDGLSKPIDFFRHL